MRKTMRSNNLARMVKAIGQSQKFPVADLVKKDPESAALLSKLVADMSPRRISPEDQYAHHRLTSNRLPEISHDIQQRLTDYENITKLFPDFELAIQILVSSILSPKDLGPSELIYQTDEAMGPSELMATINEKIRTHHVKYYDIDNNLALYLRNALFDRGSYPIAVIPESSVDELIHGDRAISAESLEEVGLIPKNPTRSLKGFPNPMGYLGNSEKKSRRFSFESLDSRPMTDYDPNIKTKKETSSAIAQLLSLEDYLNSEPGKDVNPRYKPKDIDEAVSKIAIIDNFEYLKFPAVLLSNGKKRVNEQLAERRMSLEAYALEANELSHTYLTRTLYRKQATNNEVFRRVKTEHETKRRSVGLPLVQALPTEAVIPIHVPGNPRNHIGYFVMIDEEGNPISKESQNRFLSLTNGTLLNQTQPVSSYLLDKARSNLVGYNDMSPMDQASSIFGRLIEDELASRIQNGVYGQKADVGWNLELYRIMLARTLANQYTRLLYIPEELLAYFALDFHPNGVGKSLLDDLKILIGIRGILLFAQVMAEVKSSINLTKVNMTLDPKDPDPWRTITVGMHEVVRMRQNYFPLGINTPIDLADWITRAGFEFGFEGHPKIPNTKFDFETRNIQHTKPDSELSENLRKQTYMALTLSPETVDQGFTGDFATSIVSNNILLAKRVYNIQRDFLVCVRKYIQTITKNDYKLRPEIYQLIKENKEDLLQYLGKQNKEEFILQNDQGEKEIDYIAYVDEYIERLKVDLPKPDAKTLDNQATAFDAYTSALDNALNAYISAEFITPAMAGELSNNINDIRAAYKAQLLRDWMAKNGYMDELGDIIRTNEDGKAVIDIQDATLKHIEGLMKSSGGMIIKLNEFKAKTDKILSNAGVDTGGGGSDFGGDSFGGEDESGVGNGSQVGGDEEPSAEVETNAEEEPKNQEEEKPETDQEDKQDQTNEKS